MQKSLKLKTIPRKSQLTSTYSHTKMIPSSSRGITMLKHLRRESCVGCGPSMPLCYVDVDKGQLNPMFYSNSAYKSVYKCVWKNIRYALHFHMCKH